MKKIKALISLLASLALLASCGEAAFAPAPSGGPADQAADTAAETAAPELRFEGEKITVAVWEMADMAAEVDVDEQNGEIVNDAVYSRNLAVSEKLGAELDTVSVGPGDFTVTDTIANSIRAGDAVYDVCCMPTIASTAGSLEGLYRDLTKLPHLDLTAKYWSRGYCENMKIGEALYLVSGSPAISMLRYIYVTVCNNALMASYGRESLIPTVREGKWTFGLQAEISRDIYSDLDGNGKADINDLYGFAAGARTGIDTFWTNCGANIYGRDASNYYTFEPMSERYVAAVDAVLDLYYGGEGSFVLAKDKDNFRGDALPGMFAEGRAMMLVTPIYCIETYMREMTDEFTVVPMAKLDESQPEYYSYVQDQFTSYYVPVTVTDDRAEAVGAFLDLFGAESYDTVFNAYYENALSYKYMQNEESVEMLHLIVDSMRIDPSAVYSDEGGVKVELRNMIAKKTNSFVSDLAKVESRINGVLEDLNSRFASLQG
ncbi:MAG: hypothetical protein K6D94_01465 [Clostridiales bacterium]|nr:hypothetical protein [Clostridiales bacterium]